MMYLNSTILRKKSLVLLALIIPIALIFISNVSAQEHVAGYGEICFPCHNTLLTEDEKVAKLAHCRCHSVDIWRGDKVEMGKLSKLHGDAPCIKCHAGPTFSTEDIDVLNVHTPHSTVKCSSCHGEQGAVIVPDTESCLSCHKGGVHEIHEDVLIDVCVGCHGKVIHKFAELRSEVGITEVETPVEEKKPFSLYDLIRSILSFFTGGV